MSRKREEPQSPVVTSLPLPSSDSVLVIDLPDGQKLLVGKMSHGTVIEVATWRGTGRPDSRTNRLMLGMSSSETEAPTTQPEEEMVVDKRSIRYWIWLLLQSTKRIVGLTKALAGKAKVIATQKRSSTKALPAMNSVEDDVQIWLDNIKSSSSQSTPATKAAGKSISTSKTLTTAKKVSKKATNKPKPRAKG